mmetsp:Transcript_24971/g.63731  ORF Transcript_24971/g.63731 Transcript_24971/m.63731 type:complete len:602 (+) Transcript_24971:35-1840(+)
MPTTLNVQNHVKGIFARALGQAFPAIRADVALQAANPRFGDYQCNNAMAIFRSFGPELKGEGINTAKDVGEKIVACLPTDAKDKVFETTTVAPAGFVTVKLKDSFLVGLVTDIVANGVAFESSPKRRVVIDFSSPNIAKEMHVGHLRSTVIGEACARILEFAGHEVHRLNHTGDWGTQFGMLIEHLQDEFPDFQKARPPLSDLVTFYKAAKKRFDEDEAFKGRARQKVVALQSGEPAARTAWTMLCDISREEFQKVFDRLDVTLTERGESFYNPLIAPLVKQLEQRGLVQESNGAKVIYTPRISEVPLMAVKSDGGFGYDSTDLACIYHRLFVMRAEWIIYVTDAGQENHFLSIFDAAAQAGWHRPVADHRGGQPIIPGQDHFITRCDHMGFGVVTGEDGKKFKTRSGETVKLVDLLDEAVARARTELVTRQATQEDKLTDAELDAAAAKIGYSAVKYADLKGNRITSYAFSFDKMLDPKGNTAVYLLYAYARIQQMKIKAGVDVGKVDLKELKLGEAAERALALHLLQFPEIIEAILQDLNIHRLAEYLYGLCTHLATFYTKCKVVGTPEQNSRLLLIEATRKVMLQGFHLLGIQELDRI